MLRLIQAGLASAAAGLIFWSTSAMPVEQSAAELLGCPQWEWCDKEK